ncbi:MAG: RNase P subunit p30 family protein [Candidatus Bathyarchaeota archaeon]|nr:RNase P subunit p30 family protein [Candidatus Bathyarchaeota archaeon]
MKYMDLHIQPDEENKRQMLSHAVTLGLDAVGIPIDRSMKEEHNIDIVSRLDIAPKNQQQLSGLLKKNRRRYEVISVLCLSKNVARQAAKDHRVDILRYPDDSRRKHAWMDRHQATLAKDSGCSYEVDIKELLVEDARILRHKIIQLRKETSIALKHDIPVIASSGATDWLGMREPKAVAALMSLLDVDEEKTLEMVSRNPCALVERNRDKLSDSYVLPGVWVIES